MVILSFITGSLSPPGRIRPLCGLRTVFGSRQYDRADNTLKRMADPYVHTVTSGSPHLETHRRKWATSDRLILDVDTSSLCVPVGIVGIRAADYIPNRVPNYAASSLLIGVGPRLAAGCNIATLFSGVALLSVHSFPVGAGIILGVYVMTHYIYREVGCAI